MFNFSKLTDRLFRKTILLSPSGDGVIEAIDITGNVKSGLYNNGDKTILISPRRLYRVRGLRNITYIAIQEPNASSQLLDLYATGAGALNEKLLGDMLSLAELAGAEQSSSQKTNNIPTLTLVASAISALVGVLIYMKLAAIPT